MLENVALKMEECSHPGSRRETLPVNTARVKWRLQQKPLQTSRKSSDGVVAAGFRD